MVDYNLSSLIKADVEGIRWVCEGSRVRDVGNLGTLCGVADEPRYRSDSKRAEAGKPNGGVFVANRGCGSNTARRGHQRSGGDIEVQEPAWTLQLWQAELGRRVKLGTRCPPRWPFGDGYNCHDWLLIRRRATFVARVLQRNRLDLYRWTAEVIGPNRTKGGVVVLTGSRTKSCFAGQRQGDMARRALELAARGWSLALGVLSRCPLGWSLEVAGVSKLRRGWCGRRDLLLREATILQ